MNIDDSKVVKIFLLPGGKVPERKKDGRAYDTFLYEIQSPKLDTVWTFEDEPHADIHGKTDFRKVNGNEVPEPVYILGRMEQVRVSFGFVLGMTAGWCAWVAPRSSTAAKRIGAFTHPLGSALPELDGVVDYYQHVPIDWNYRGKPTTLLENYSDDEFVLARGQRITQLVFQGPNGNWFPQFKIVNTIEELGDTERGGNGHGSSGTH